MKVAWPPEGLERDVDSAAADGAHLLHGVAQLRVDRVRRAECDRASKLVLRDVDRDDHLRPGRLDDLDEAGTDATDADDGHCVTGLDLTRAEGSAVRRQAGTAQDARGDWINLGW